jgi:hypothetical protein
MPAAPVPPAAVPTIVATCAVHIDKFAVVNGVGVAADCIHNAAEKPGNTLFGKAMLYPLN